jgi:nucleoside-diphosphate-sugar epimerase
MNQQRLLITGATGYVGSNLVKHLLHAGHNIHILVRPNSKLGPLESIENQLTIHKHDGSTEHLVDLVKNAKPTTVLHLASLFLAQHQTSDITRLIESNVLFPSQLLEAMVVNGVKHLINTGTSWQHHENQAYNPVNLYAASKQAFEDLLSYYTETAQIKACSLLLFDTYGPADPRGKLISLLWKTALHQTPLSMSPGDQEIDLVHIDDVSRAFETALAQLPTQQQAHTRYGVSSGHPLPLKTLVREFERITGYHLPIEFGGRPYRPREVMATWKNFRTLPLWQTKVTLDEGLPSSQPTHGMA